MANVLDQQYNPTVNTDYTLRYSAVIGVKLGQSFVPSTTQPVGKVTLKLKKLGSPTGNIWVTIEADSTGVPSGTSLSQSANIDVSTLTTSYVSYDFNFSGPTSITSGGNYWIVLQGDYSVSSTDNAIIGVRQPDGSYASGLFKTYDGSSWSDPGSSHDAWFDEYYDADLVSTGGFFYMSV